MPQVLAKQIFLQLMSIDQIAVMGQGDPVGRIDVERLRLGRRRAARGRVADMTDAHRAGAAAVEDALAALDLHRQQEELQPEAGATRGDHLIFL